MKVHYPKLYNMAHLLALNILLLPKDLTIIIINHFHFSCLRKLLNIKWQDKIPDTEVLKKAVVQSMHS